jgi:hypothetical protein
MKGISNGGVAQAIECLPSKCEILSSNSSATRRRKKEEEEGNHN